MNRGSIKEKIHTTDYVFPSFLFKYATSLLMQDHQDFPLKMDNGLFP